MRLIDRFACAAARAAALVTLLGLLLAGCATPSTPAGRPIAPTAVPAGQAAVFGRIALVRDGKEAEWFTGPALLGPGGHLVWVWSAQTGKITQHLLAADGRFVWPLPPGDYTIAAVSVDWIARGMGRMWVAFRVEREGEAVYIGSLRMRFAGSRYSLDLDDQFDAELAGLGGRLAGAVPAAGRAIAQLEPRVGAYTGLWSICAERGGLSCDRTWAGVEPVQPAGTARSFVGVDSLTPVLEWKPTPRPGLRYDVAVYESLPLSLDMPSAARVRGPLSAYVEGLDEPRWQVTPALKPDTKYEWSVRLRDGDAVSTWSTSSQFTFLLVAAIVTHGDWFGLATRAR